LSILKDFKVTTFFEAEYRIKARLKDKLTISH